MKKEDEIMINKLNPDQIEKSIISYFDYISQLHGKIRELKYKIKFEEELLNKNRKEEKEYLDMLHSDCTGKGSYHDSIMLPLEIKNQFDKNHNLSQEEQKKLKENYDLTIEYAKKLEQRYQLLRTTERKRINQIKKSKNNLKKYKIKLNKLKKEYNNNMSRIKKMDSKLNKIKKNNIHQLIYENNNKE